MVTAQGVAPKPQTSVLEQHFAGVDSVLKALRRNKVYVKGCLKQDYRYRSIITAMIS